MTALLMITCNGRRMGERCKQSLQIPITTGVDPVSMRAELGDRGWEAQPGGKHLCAFCVSALGRTQVNTEINTSKE